MSLENYPAPVAFCEWFLQQCGTKPIFLACVLFTDEATFTRDGIQNLHNQHVWADENHHVTVQSHYQQRFCINIWAGIVGDCSLESQVLPNKLTEDRTIKLSYKII